MISIHLVANRGLVYEVEDIKYLREVYNICGTLVGVLPQFPQQNVFKGIPLELLPEDIELLVNDLHVARIIDDSSLHQLSLDSLTEKDIKEVTDLQKADQLAVLADYRSTAWVRKEALLRQHNVPITETLKHSYLNSITEENYLVFETPSSTSLESYMLLKNDNNSKTSKHLEVPGFSSKHYDIYRYFHAKGFYMCSALRFGAHFMAYPGDPLRYHSHYIADGYEMDEEFDLLDLVTKGRLATTVKKCWVIGSRDSKNDTTHIYSIEWARFG